MGEFTNRVASLADVPALVCVMDAAIVENQRAFLSDAQIEASREVMGLDTQLIEDGTYFVVECGGDVAGCGGWSRRATMYGGNQTPGRDAALLDPATDAARVRAMYTNPAFARRGVGRLILSLCEAAAAAEGFVRLELMATMSGRPLYESYGFAALGPVIEIGSGEVRVPVVSMGRPIDRSQYGARDADD